MAFSSLSGALQRWHAQDFTFFLHDARGPDMPHAPDPVLVVTVLEERVLRRLEPLGSFVVPLTQTVQLKSGLRMVQPSKWVPVRRVADGAAWPTARRSSADGPAVPALDLLAAPDGPVCGWMRLRVQVNMETTTSGGILTHLGSPVRAVPFRMSAGDVLLFHTAGAVGRFIGVFTASPWDHVGLVVCRVGYAGLLCLEATSEGVQGAHCWCCPGCHRSLTMTLVAYPLEQRLQGWLDAGATVGLRRLVDVEVRLVLSPMGICFHVCTALAAFF